MTATTWGPLLEAWGSYLRTTGRPDTTIGLRTYHVRRLAEDFPRGPSSIGFEPLVEWLAGHEWAPNTRRSYRASLRAFWSWLLATGRTSESPAHLLPPVTVPRALPRPLPEGDFAFALSIADRRARLAIMLAGFCGLRRGEIARSRREHLEASAGGWVLLVIGKGGKERRVPLPPEIVAEIQRVEKGWLFPSSHGGHLTPHHLGKVVSTNLPGAYATHSLRHRCGTQAYAGTKDLRAVQELLGHAKPETTAIYTAVPDESIRAAMMHAVQVAA